MGSFRSKEDDVAKISTSIFVSNFPDSVSAKDLFHSCKQYGHVVDSFIPMKRLKDGKRFGFVRFINVFNVERLVNNLCTIWLNHCKLHANIARFNRDQKNGNKYKTEKKHEGRKNTFYDPRKCRSYRLNTEFSEDEENSDGMKERQSEDPFGLYSILNKNKVKSDVIREVNDENPSLKYPPGFTPSVERMVQVKDDQIQNISDNQLNGDNESVHQVEREDNKNSDGAKTNSTGSRKFKMSEIPRTGGSILSVMEEIMKVGITMGYNMDGCANDITKIIESQGGYGVNR
ncbi:nucleotide-binding alpha-beta plait domain-containing protein [Tanacetum coccineum]